MKGDFTRVTHNPEKQYNRVLKQQGRVDLDADWNEQVDITRYLAQTQAVDVIGDCGVPKKGGGYLVTAVSTDGTDFEVSAGRIYAGGILCELPAATSYLHQAGVFPNPPALNLPAAGRTDLIYLDVWERHLTAIEDPDMREVALGGPDTTTRVQAVAQVKVMPGVGNVTCADTIPNWPPLPGNGRLTTAANQPPSSTDPCVIAPGGGYRGLENRLYRVEIHDDTASGAATFKWSRDNGAVLFAIESFVSGEPNKVKVRQLGKDQVLALQVDSWVEVLDDATELRGEPGTVARITDIDAAQRILTLSKPVSGYSTSGHPRVRRWDMSGDVIPVAAGPISLEDGVEVSFGGTDFHSGDYWVFAARTVTANGDSGIEILTDAPAQGIAHSYCPLAIVSWSFDGTNWSAAIEDCRPTFPSLTEICAEDVCFDNSDCQLVGADTVQDAIDQLCAANDLRHHNKHLHGWGIVCGLQVACGPDALGEPRRHVTVRDGYAIDCEGNDLLIPDKQDVVLDLMQAIADLQAQDPNNPILSPDGDGEVCLTMGLDAQQQLAFDIERYDPSKSSWAARFDGTLLMDFYDDCIAPLVQYARKMLAISPDPNAPLVSPGQAQFITLLNLIVQLFNPTYGRYVFLSPKEDQILRDLYLGLRALLQSETFCAMFDNARPFPDYPFPNHGISTVFGKGYHGRLRLHPREPLGFTTGVDNKIHVYNLNDEKMIAEVEVPGGSGIIVRDVAFSEDGNQIFAIATLQGEDTIFAAGELSGKDVRWQPIVVLCDLVLTTLGTAPAVSNLVYAVGNGSSASGFFALDPDNIVPDPKPVHPFTSAGHLVIVQETGVAYASVQGPNQSAGVYAGVKGMDLSAGNDWNYSLTDPTTGEVMTGQDDIIAVLDQTADQVRLYAVVNQTGNMSGKGLAVLDGRDTGPIQALIDLSEDTDVRLGHVTGSGELIVSLEDSYRLRLVNMSDSFLHDDFHFPVQISPLGLAYDANTDTAYALNILSNTLTTIPAAYLDPANPPAITPVPGSQAFLIDLETYRTAIFAAFLDLLGGLLQYLKDCFCDHLLVNCPDCDVDDKIYLGCISVRSNQVYKVCNFSLRKYVKSFPTVGYWLSLVPVAPLVDKVVEELCCAVLPSLFGKYAAPQANAYQAPVKGAQMRQGVMMAQTTDFRGLWQSQLSQLNVARRVSTAWLGDRLAQPPDPGQRQKKRLPQQSVVDKPVADVSKQLDEANIKVAGVRPFDPAAGVSNLRRIATAPTQIPAGAEVTLFEQDGVVKFYSVEKAAVTPPLKARATATEVAVPTEDVVQLRSQLETQQTRVQALEAELAELRSFREEVRAFMGDNPKRGDAE